MSIRIDTVSVPAASGAMLNAFVCAPSDPIAVVQINHGLAEHAGRYGEFQVTLAEQGIASISHDHRGHGKTSGPDVSQGVFAASDGDKAVVADAVFLHSWCEDRWPTSPRIVFGHSMGGLIALGVALELRDRLAGLAIWNSNLAPGVMGRVGQGVAWLEEKVFGRTKPGKAIPAMTFQKWDKAFAADGPTFHWLSSDPAEVQAYIDDPDCGFSASTSMWSDILRLTAAGEDDAGLATLPKAMPVHLVAGGQDPATFDGAATKAFAARLARLGFNNVVVSIDPDVRHETLNEHNRATAMKDFSEWVIAATSAAATDAI